MKTAFITGATGCVGRNLVDILQEDGWRIICLHRASSDLSRLEGCDVECREVNLHDLNDVHSVIERADAIFHIAANVSHNPMYHAEQRKDNVIATYNLVMASLDKIRRFVFTSTGAAARGDGLSYDEIDKLRSGYIKTKKQSEIIVDLAVENYGLDAVTLRPIIIVGKYDYNNYSQIFSMLKTGKLRNSIPGALPFCNAEDIARAHLTAFERGRCGEQYYLGGEHTTWHDFCCRACDLMGIKHPRKPLPLWMYYVTSHCMMLHQKWTGKPALITPELVDLMSTESNDLPYSEYEKTRTELGYESRSLDISLRECYDWMIDNNMLAG